MIEPSPKRNIFLSLLAWHFYDAPKEILKAWGNFLVFVLRYFSIGILLKTFFSHFRHLREPYGRGFDIKKYSMVFIGNIISRIIGAFVRTIIILTGLITEIFVFLLGFIILIAWLLAPFLIIIGIYSGVIIFV